MQTRKIILIGLEKSGKTQLYNKLKDKPAAFEYEHRTTIGADFTTVRDTDNNQKLQIWDTAGQERFQMISNMYIVGASVLLFTLSCDKNFDAQLAGLKTRKDTIAREVVGFEQMRKLLVFTKLDGENTLSEEQIDRAKFALGIQEHLTCSAKEIKNIQAVKEKLFAIGNEINNTNTANVKPIEINLGLDKGASYFDVPLEPKGFFDRHIKPNGFWENHKTAFKVLSFATLGMFFGLYKLSMYLENRNVPSVSMAAHGSTTSTAMRGILGSGDYRQADKREEKTFSAANSLQDMQLALDSSKQQSNNCFSRSNRR